LIVGIPNALISSSVGPFVWKTASAVRQPNAIDDFSIRKSALRHGMAYGTALAASFSVDLDE